MKPYLQLLVLLMHNLLHSSIKPEIIDRSIYPLHFAAYIGNRSGIVDMIREGLADVNDIDGTGRTAAHWAAIANQSSTIDNLHALGANLMATDRLGNTPLDFAQYYKHDLIINTLHDYCS